MDISNLAPQKDTVVTKLTNPKIVTKFDDEGNEYKAPSGEILTHDKKEMWVERYLPHTDEYKQSQYKRTQKYIKAAQKTNNTNIDIDLYEAEKDRIEVMAETTAAWQIYYGGEWLEFTPEKAKEVYTTFFWIVEQLQEEENSVDVFTKV
jgi:hypothetical protein